MIFDKNERLKVKLMSAAYSFEKSGYEKESSSKRNKRNESFPYA